MDYRQNKNLSHNPVKAQLKIVLFETEKRVNLNSTRADSYFPAVSVVPKIALLNSIYI